MMAAKFGAEEAALRGLAVACAQWNAAVDWAASRVEELFGGEVGPALWVGREVKVH